MSGHELTDPDAHMKTFAETRVAPDCGCGGYLKRATVSFGQKLRPEDLRRATRSAGKADLVIVLDSTLSVYPAAGFPVAAAERGASYVVINRGVTDHDGHTAPPLRLEGDVVALLPPAVAAALA